MQHCVNVHWDSRRAAEQTTLHHPHCSQTILRARKHLLTCTPQSHTRTFPPFHFPSFSLLPLSLTSSLCCFLLVFHATFVNFQLHFELFWLCVQINVCYTEESTQDKYILDTTRCLLAFVCVLWTILKFSLHLSPQLLSLFSSLPRSSHLNVFVWVSADLSTCQHFQKTGPCAFLALSPFLSCRFFHPSFSVKCGRDTHSIPHIQAHANKRQQTHSLTLRLKYILPLSRSLTLS